jgi:hypothetical protein
MKVLIDSLLRTISRMETEQQEQRTLLDLLLQSTANASPAPSTATATQSAPATGKKAATSSHDGESHDKPKSYANCVDSTSKSNVKNKVRKEKQQSDVIVNPKCDVKSDIPENKKEQYPHVLFLQDSVCRDINPSRMGRSYDVYVESKRVSMIDSIIRTAEESIEADTPPDSIIFHVGINDVKTKDPADAGRQLADSITEVGNMFPNAKLICSQAIPTKNRILESKRVLFNAHVYAAINRSQQAKNISFITHENIALSKHMKDDIHPNVYGSATLARNLGQHVRSLFWERPRRKRFSQARGLNWMRENYSRNAGYKRTGPSRPQQPEAEQSFLPPPPFPMPGYDRHALRSHRRPGSVKPGHARFSRMQPHHMPQQGFQFPGHHSYFSPPPPWLY